MFSESLRRAMRERGVTASALAAMTGLSKSGVSQYLSGKTVPSEESKRRLAEALDAALDGGAPGEGDEGAPGEGDEGGARNLPVEEAARLLGKSKQFVRVSLQSGRAPFGFAVKVTGDRFSYHISPKKFNEYMGGAP